MDKYSVKRADISLFILQIGFILKIITILTFDTKNIACDLFFYFLFFCSFLYLKKYNLKQLRFSIFAFVYLLVYFSSERRNFFLLFMIVSYILISCSKKNFLKTTLLTSIVVFIVICLLISSGKVINLYFRDYDGSIYYNFGFKNPNIFALFFFGFMVCCLLLFRKLLRNIIDIIFIFLSILVFKYTGCKTLIICTILLYTSYFFLKNINGKVIKFLCIVLPVLITTMLIYFTLNLNKFVLIDVFLTGRLSLYSSLFSHANFLDIVFGNSHLITVNDITLDNAYFMMIFSGGLISFFIFFKLYMRFITQAFKCKDWFSVAIIISYLCYGIMESVFTNILLYTNLVFWFVILHKNMIMNKNTDCS